MISTLIPDIYATIQKKDGWFTDELADSFSRDVAARLQVQLGEKKESRLRLSQMGPRCPCALWYSIHHPELAEPLPPWAEIKYSYGHILEAFLIMLARASGHQVEGEQDELTVDGVTGHRDCIIDGNIVDVKSSSSMGFNKFKDGSIRNSDHFGYLDQLDGYLTGSLDDPRVTNKTSAFLFAVDKQLGHLALYEHGLRELNIRNRIAEYKQIVGRDTAPACSCETVPDGKSGNIKLGTKASYSTYKHCCFPSLRTFLYASGPVYLTHVARKPDVPELNRTGQIVYN